MEKLINRNILNQTIEILRAFPCLIMEGAGQVGKSTLAEMVAERLDGTVVTLDDPLSLNLAQNDPVTFLRQANGKLLVIDEVQKCPELILNIKIAIDEDKRPGMFLLTGSSNILQLRNNPESLAGRAVSLKMFGFSQGEINGEVDDFARVAIEQTESLQSYASAYSSEMYANIMGVGGYPEIQFIPTNQRQRWYAGYINRIVERDIRDISTKLMPERLRALVNLIAANQSGELVKERFAKDAGVPTSSITAYIDALDTMNIIEQIPPLLENLTKRETKYRKAQVSDTGLAMYLNKNSEEKLLRPAHREHFGSMLESFVVLELLKQREWSKYPFDIFHLRDSDGIEVDIALVFENDGVMLIEVKSNATYKPKHFNNIRRLADRLGDRFVGGFVLGTANDSVIAGDKIYGMPVSALWEV